MIIEFLKSLNISFYEFAIITTSFPCIFISHVPNFLVTKNLNLISKLFTILFIKFFIIMHISSNIVQDDIFFRFLLGYQCFVLSMFL